MWDLELLWPSSGVLEVEVDEASGSLLFRRFGLRDGCLPLLGFRVVCFFFMHWLLLV